MKGVELPINILVVVAVAVIVLLGVIALYFSGFLGPAGTITQESAKNTACAKVMNEIKGCITVDPDLVLLDGTPTSAGRFDANKDGAITAADTLTALCLNYYTVTTKPDCRRLCGCTG